MPDAYKNISLSGKYAWISGGASGLGYAFAKALLVSGAAGVCIADIADYRFGEAAVKNLIHEASTYSQKQCFAMFSRCDVRDADAVEKSMQVAFDSFGGRLDIVINNAGISDETDLDNILAVNLRSVITGTEFAVHLMESMQKEWEVGARASCIVNVASAAGIMPLASSPVYSATKHGVVGYSLSRAESSWLRNVRINVLCPGPTRTALTAGKDKQLKETRLGLMEPPTVAGAMLQIVTSSSMNGEALYVSEKTGVLFPLRAIVGELRNAARRRALEGGDEPMRTEGRTSGRGMRHARL
jgi:NAD(P)-dependent dehydrogenase (short-subunit alcohol dehydrogenase family)